MYAHSYFAEHFSEQVEQQVFAEQVEQPLFLIV